MMVLMGGTRLIFAYPSYLVLVTAGIIAGIFGLRKQSGGGGACVGVFLIWVGYLGARIWFSPDVYLARNDMGLLLAVVLVYLLFSQVLTDSKRRIWFIWLLLLVAVGQVVIGAIQFTKGDNWLPFGFLRPDYGARASGMYGCPNHFAGYLEMVMMMGAGLLLWGRLRIGTKILLGYILLVCFAGVAITGSRGGYFSLLFGWIVFGILSLRVVRISMPERFWKLTWGWIGIMGIGFGGAVYMMLRSQLLTNRLLQMGDTQNMRIEMWNAALQQWQLSPWLGTGSQSFMIFGRTFRPIDGYQLDPIFTHNDYLQLLAEFGVVGVILFLGMWWWHLRRAGKMYERYARERVVGFGSSNSLAILIGGVSALSTMVIHTFFDFNFHIAINALVAAAFLGMLVVVGEERERKQQKVGEILFKLMMIPVAVLLAFEALPRIKGEYYAELTRAKVRDKEYREAIDLAKTGIIYDASNPYLHFYLGQARLYWGGSMGNRFIGMTYVANSVESLTQAVELFPNNIWMLIPAGQAHAYLGEPEKAEAFYRRALQLDPFQKQMQRIYESHARIIRKKRENDSSESPTFTVPVSPQDGKSHDSSNQ